MTSMFKRWAPYIVLSIGFGVLCASTDHFHAFTTEGARRFQVLDNPQTLPPVTLTDMNGKNHQFKDFANKLVLVDFIYTSCPTICYAMGSALEVIQKKLIAQDIAQDVLILSISFDPERDDAIALSEYGERYQADPDYWNIVTVTDKGQLEQLLNAFGITVLPTPDGEFEHNASIHLMDRHGKLVGIYDFSSPYTVLQAVEAYL